MKTSHVFSLSAALLLGLSGQAMAAKVYVTDSGNLINVTTINSMLTTAGHTVTNGVFWKLMDGTQGLSSYDAVILLPSYNWSGGTMSVAGQNNLLNFVGNGGGLITSEWFVWALGTGSYYPNLAPLSPVNPTTGYRYTSPITYTQGSPDPTLNNGVNSPFTFTADSVGGTETFLTAKTGATVFYSSDYGGGGLVGWDMPGNGGRVLSFSTLIGNSELSDPNYQQLFVNSVDWVTTPVPIPGAFLLFGSGILGLATLRKKRITYIE